LLAGGVKRTFFAWQALLHIKLESGLESAMPKKPKPPPESEEWLEWCRLTPQQRWAATDQLWALY
jgi:hypothetical protein